MRLRNKAWFLSGAALGFVVAIGLHLCWVSKAGCHPMHPIAELLFWPTSILPVGLGSASALATSLFAVGANALLYGLVAAKLRRFSIGVLVLLLIPVWISLPPSDSALRERFVQYRPNLEQLIQMSNQDDRLARISPSFIETDDQKTYRADEPQTLLSQQRWNEYRRLFEATHLNEGLIRDRDTGDVFFVAHTTLGKHGWFGSYFGYVFCAVKRPGRTSHWAPCRERRESVHRSAYRYRVLESNWYIYEVFMEWSLGE